MTRRGALNEGLISGSVGLVSRVAIQLCLLAVTLTATRYLAISEFGIYSVASALMFLSRNLFYVGPYEYLLKTPSFPGLKGACLKANLGLAVAASIPLLMFVSISEFIFGSRDLPFVLLRLVPALLLSAMTAWYEAVLLRDLAIRRYYLFTVIGELFGAVVAIAFFYYGYELRSLIAQTYTRLGILLLLYVLSTRVEGWRNGSVAEVRKVLDWSLSRFGAVFLNFSANYGADFVLGIALSPAATGLYRASNRIVSSISDLFAQPLQKIVQTNLSARSSRGLRPDHSWIAMLTAVASIGWAALLGLAVSAKQVVLFILGPAWEKAAPIIVVFCAARALSLIDAATTSLLVCCDRQKFMLKVQTTVAVLVPVSSLGLTLVVPQASELAPTVVALSYLAIMSGLTLAYGREAARLSSASARDVFVAMLFSAIPGLFVTVALIALETSQFGRSLEQRLFVASALVVSVIALVFGLMVIRKRLLSSIQSLGYARLAGEDA